ncbi:MAG: hypothetical protein RL088_28 [Verrucomicrobiota bacterium]|jgi:cell division protein FtsL
MSNRYKTAKQSLPLTAWIIGAAVAACVVGFGVKFLMVKYQIFQGGRTVKEMEVRLSRLITSNEDLQAKVDTLTARPELKKKHAAGYLKMREIVEEKDVIHPGRDDRRVEWKSGVATLTNGRPAETVAKKSEEDDGGTR